MSHVVTDIGFRCPGAPLYPPKPPRCCGLAYSLSWIPIVAHTTKFPVCSGNYKVPVETIARVFGTLSLEHVSMLLTLGRSQAKGQSHNCNCPLSNITECIKAYAKTTSYRFAILCLFRYWSTTTISTRRLAAFVARGFVGPQLSIAIRSLFTPLLTR